MSANGAKKERDLSLRTLAIAAIASGIAAIVTSTFWKNGTFVTAALTPVIVAFVKEGLQRPIESDLVRRPVQRISTTRSGRRVPEYAHTGAPEPFEPEPRDPAHPGNGAPPTGYGPVRTYGRPRRRWHVRAAIVTGVVAFAIAALVLTLPELLFGGSVAGKGRTTFFPAKVAKSRSSSKSDQQKTSTDSTKTDTNQQTTTTPQQQGTSTTTQPQQQTPPAQQSPGQGGTPAPQQAPAPVAPPASSSP